MKHACHRRNSPKPPIKNGSGTAYPADDGPDQRNAFQYAESLSARQFVPGSFSGSGAIGIEALSRGASHAVFVDRDNACCNVIRENLAFTHLDAHSEVLRKDALSAVAFLEGRKEAFDIIFMDPPYASDGVGTVLERLDGSSLVAPHTILIFEEDIRFPLDFIDGLSFEVMKEKKYKTNKHVWLKKV